MKLIPTIGEYRGVPLHNFQDEQRLAIVRKDIDEALSLADCDRLFAFACSLGKAPESRLLAAQKVHEKWNYASELGAARPKLSLDVLDAWVAGLDSNLWRSPVVFGVLSDSVKSGAIPRAVPLPDRR